jgi:hypothetical protein
MRRIVQSRPSPSLVISVLALFVALGGSAYALSRGEVKAKHIASGAVTTPKLRGEAVTGAKVRDFRLRLRDLGGKTNDGTDTVDDTITVPPEGCEERFLELFNPAPEGVIGSLVVGFLTDDQGDAVLANHGVVVPTMISETSQGGAIATLMVCDLGGAGQTVPAGSVFHYRLIGP